MNINKIVVHISDSPHGRNDGAKEIHKWHKSPPNNWDGIGYHYVILEDGRLETGRPEYWTGAHVKGHNSNSLGICLIGKPNKLSNIQLESLGGFLESLRYKHPEAKIYGHSDLDKNKPYCPSDQVMDFLGRCGLLN